jgi:hypothetical protein
MSKSQQERDAKTIQQLTSQNQSLKKKLAEQQTLHLSPTEEGTSKILRGTLESYFAMVLGIAQGVWHMNWILRTVLFVILCGICGSVAWASPLTYKWRKIFRVMLTVLVVTLVAWIGYVNVSQQLAEEGFPADAQYFMTWKMSGEPGTTIHVTPGHPPITQGSMSSTVTINGALLYRHADKYKLVAVCLHNNGQDLSDVRDISKSAAFNIVQGPFTVIIPWNETFINEVGIGARQTTYALILIPKNMNPNDFGSIGEAVSRGAVLLQHVGGPP